MYSKIFLHKLYFETVEGLVEMKFVHWLQKQVGKSDFFHRTILSDFYRLFSFKNTIVQLSHLELFILKMFYTCKWLCDSK